MCDLTLSPLSQVMIAEALDIARETYLAILMDRSHGGPVLVGSPEGGVDIEEVAEKTPEKIIKVDEDYVPTIMCYVVTL